MSIKAVIFDMDGVLIDSEPLWRRAELEVYHDLGMSVTDALLRKTTGLRVDDVVEYWLQQIPPKKDISVRECTDKIIDGVVALISREGVATPGVQHVLDIVHERGYKTAIASSSYESVIHAVLSRLGIQDQIDVIYSAEHEQYGKPHPGVYITTARTLGVEPTESIAVEDSAFGVLAAKAARMACIAIPSDGQQDKKEMLIADRVYTSLEEISQETFDSLTF